jgi:hypothetical protein
MDVAKVDLPVVGPKDDSLCVNAACANCGANNIITESVLASMNYVMHCASCSEKFTAIATDAVGDNGPLKAENPPTENDPLTTVPDGAAGDPKFGEGAPDDKKEQARLRKVLAEEMQEDDLQSGEDDVLIETGEDEMDEQPQQQAVPKQGNDMQQDEARLLLRILRPLA